MGSVLRIWSAVAAVLASALVTQGAASWAQTAAPKSARPRVAFLLADTNNVRWFKDIARFKARLHKLYPSAVVEAASAAGNPMTQLGQADSELSKGAKVLVVVPAGSSTATQIVDTAHRAGAAVIAYDSPIYSRHLDFYDGYDALATGKMQGQWLARHVKRGGTIVLINGARHNQQAELLHDGYFSDILAAKFRSRYYKLGADIWTAHGTHIEAQTDLDRYLHTHRNQVEGVLAADDELATGVVYSLSGVGLQGRTAVTGQDATVYALQRILDGTQGMTAYKPYAPEADAAAEAANTLLRHGSLSRSFRKRLVIRGAKVPATQFVPIVITRTNLSRVIQDGAVSRTALCTGEPKKVCDSL